MRVSAVAVVAWLVLHAGAAFAQQAGVPAELKAWEPWVMYGEEFRRCPLRNAADASQPNDAAAFVCMWPGRMQVAVSSSGGEFSQRWRLYSDGWVTLPGDEIYWPEEVRVNGTPQPVVLHEGAPGLHLGAGDYSVSGRFTWSRRPEALHLAPATALVDLSIDGKPISPVELRDDRLWLGAVRTVTVPRALQVQVYRLLQDGIPLQLTTRVQLKVSGDSREELLARVLPEGFVPMSVSGMLPMRFEPDGRLRVQVRSGEHMLTISARAAAPGNSVAVPTGEGFWSDAEIWSYRSDDRLRVTAIESAAPIDPVQAGVPQEWYQLPAFRLERGATIAIAERSRGLNGADANQLTLKRDLWLTFDHRRFVAADTVAGTMQQGWRLDMASPYRLLSAKRDNESMLITDGGDGRTGVEIRTPSVSITTLSQVEARGSQPVSGWDARFESLNATLHVPPGHRLLAAWGADDSPDAWLSQWRLLDLFLLMLVVAAAYRLLGWSGAVAAAIALALTHHEVDSPAWLWVNLMIVIAAMRVVPAGRLRKWLGAYQALSLLALALVLLPFAVAQYRLVLHPQLEVVHGQPYAESPSMMLNEERGMMAADAVVQLPRTMNAAAPQASVRANVPLELAAKKLDRYAPGAMLQTGPGIPDWNFLSYRLAWSGPVIAGQTLRLTILSPFWLSTWRALGLLMCAALLAMLIRLAYGVPKHWRLPPWTITAAAVSLCVLAMSTLPRPAHAESPDASVLAELKTRLGKPPECAPGCGQVAFALVQIDGDRLEVRMEVHAQADVALGVPQAGPQWVIERVLVDERPADAIAREGDRVRIPLAPGVHRVTLSGRVAQAYELSLEFPEAPRRVEVRAADWDFTGTSEGRLLNSSLQLTRRAGALAAEKTTVAQRFQPFVRIHRSAFLNLDWTVTTSVERLAPEEGAFTMRLPLLPGEAVLTPGLEVRDGSVLISMPAGEYSAQWESSLSRVDKLQWQAARDQPWVEQWDVVVSPMWHAEFSGTPAVLPTESAEGAWVNQFLPRPGESLDFSVVRPAASAGDTLAVDQVNVESRLGQRQSSTTLRFSYRSSQGGRHDLRIPSDARVQSVTVDGSSVSVRPAEGLLPLTLAPGQHQVIVNFSRDVGAGLISRPPPIDLGTQGTNVRTTMTLPEGRWILFAWGKGVGPAILYWGELVLFAFAAVLLGKWQGLPLRTRDWLFLGLGLSTFSWWVLLVFAAWLFALDRRAGWTVGTRWRFNALQSALGVLTVVALGTLVSAIPFGLLGTPDMGIRSGQSYAAAAMSWFLDSASRQLPEPAVLSVSIWFYKLAMLLWALWLSFALLRWLPWAWRQYSLQGLWRAKSSTGVEPTPTGT